MRTIKAQHVLFALTAALATSQSATSIAADTGIDKLTTAVATAMPTPLKAAYDALRARVSGAFGSDWQPATFEDANNIARPRLRTKEKKQLNAVALAMTSGPDLQCEPTDDFIKDGKCQVELVKVIEAMRTLAATQAAQLHGKEVLFKGSKFTDGGRSIVFVQVNGQDLSEEVIASGFAFYCPARHSQLGVTPDAALRYSQAQSRAQSARAGLWSTSAKAPSDCAESKAPTRLASN